MRLVQVKKNILGLELIPSLFKKIKRKLQTSHRDIRRALRSKEHRKEYKAFREETGYTEDDMVDYISTVASQVAEHKETLHNLWQVTKKILAASAVMVGSAVVLAYAGPMVAEQGAALAIKAELQKIATTVIAGITSKLVKDHVQAAIDEAGHAFSHESELP